LSFGSFQRVKEIQEAIGACAPMVYVADAFCIYFHIVSFFMDLEFAGAQVGS